MIAVIVGNASSGCELTPDPGKHAPAAAAGTPPAAPRELGPADAGAAPDATPPDAGSDVGLAKGDGTATPTADATLDGRVLARCVARIRWSRHAFFHTQRTPFSVLVGTPNHWKWVNQSTPSQQFPQHVEVPLDALVRATGIAGLTPSIEVLVVSGVATDHDVLGELDDDKLNRLIYQHQHPATGTLEPVRLAHDGQGEGKPLSFESTPGCAAGATTACETPVCPR